MEIIKTHTKHITLFGLHYLFRGTGSKGLETENIDLEPDRFGMMLIAFDVINIPLAVFEPPNNTFTDVITQSRQAGRQ